jgi:hypothetical protein
MFREGFPRGIGESPFPRTAPTLPLLAEYCCESRKSNVSENLAKADFTSPRAGRIRRPEKFRSSAEKDLFNTIGAKRTRAVKLQPQPCTPLLPKCHVSEESTNEWRLIDQCGWAESAIGICLIGPKLREVLRCKSIFLRASPPLLECSAPAFASDLPAKAPISKTPIAAPLYNWSGFYVGANFAADGPTAA